MPTVTGEVAEWSIAAVLKTASGESLTGVRIPPSPPISLCEIAAAKPAEVVGPGPGWKRKNFVSHKLINIGIWVAIVGVAFGVAWYKGYIAQLSEYVRQTREELRKCTWPTWDELKGSTLVVSIAIVLLGAFTFLADELFQHFVLWI